MKFSKTILAFAIAFILIVSCKKQEAKIDQKAVKTEKILDANAKLANSTIKIEGMTCAVGCAKTIEKNLNNSDGIKTATVDFDKKTATIEYDTNVQNPEKLIDIIQKSGDGTSYKASL
jgi:periplasmic mercuric ion binding protein